MPTSGPENLEGTAVGGVGRAAAAPDGRGCRQRGKGGEELRVEREEDEIKEMVTSFSEMKSYEA